MPFGGTTCPLGPDFSLLCVLQVPGTRTEATAVLMNINLWWRVVKLVYLENNAKEMPIRTAMSGFVPLFGIWHAYKHCVMDAYRVFPPFLVPLEYEGYQILPCLIVPGIRVRNCSWDVCKGDGAREAIRAVLCEVLSPQKQDGNYKNAMRVCPLMWDQFRDSLPGSSHCEENVRPS